MKYSIYPNTYHELRTLFIQSKPRIGFAEVTNNIIQYFILTKLVWTRNFFERLKKSGGATKDIKSRARQNQGRYTTRGYNKEVSRLMNQKIGHLNKEVRAQKHKCDSTSARVEGAFGHYRGAYVTLRKREETRVWNIEKQIKIRKLEAHKPKLPVEINGIPVGDEQLENTFGTPVVEVVALGGITPSENMKAFLRLPLKFRTYAKLDREEAVIQAEGRAARQRWVLRDKERTGPETLKAYNRCTEIIEDEKLP